MNKVKIKIREKLGFIKVNNLCNLAMWKSGTHKISNYLATSNRRKNKRQMLNILTKII